MSAKPGLWSTLWQYLERRPGHLLLGLYVVCLLAYFAAIPLPRADGQLIGSDGVYYYAYLPTLLLDGDLDFSNQYAQLLPPATVAQMPQTPTGLLPNAYAIGPALLWSPFFLVGHLLALILHVLGRPIALNGTGMLYQAVTLMGSLTYGFIGLVLAYHACRRKLGSAASILAVLLILLATNLLYYVLIEPSMSHACSFFAVALFLYLWLRWRPLTGWKHWLLLGLAGGLVALVRLPDATFVLLPLLDTALHRFARACSIPNGEQPAARAVSFCPDRWSRLLLGCALYILGFLLAMLPQMAVWQVLYGSPLSSGYLYTNQPTFAWLRPHLWQVFWHPLHGLFLWHPVTLAATLGLAWLYQREQRLALLVVLGLLLQGYVIGAWRDWGQGDAFGGRMFISSLPGLALGLAALLEWVAKRGLVWVLAWGSMLLVGWNMLFVLQYRLGYVPMNAPLTLQQFTVGKVSMLVDIARRILRR